MVMGNCILENLLAHPAETLWARVFEEFRAINDKLVHAILEPVFDNKGDGLRILVIFEE